ncbi:MAG: hypothetical protein JAZ11_00145 [Candidatus Thiodiazotropha lotti]|nr:hypothetical protein [Candidatus Thiodiazotropha lotti]
MKKSILLILVLLFFHSAATQAESLKNSDVLKFSEGQRHWWYLGAFTTLGHVAFLEDQEKGKCVWNWLYDEDEDRKAFLLESFRKFPDHTPTGIVISVLRKDCGVFPKTK